MFINYVNLFLSIFGIVVSIAAIFGPGLVIAHLKYESRYMRIILLVNLFYVFSVGLEAYIAGKPGYQVFVLMKLSNFLQYFLLYLLSAMVLSYMGHSVRKNGQISFDFRPFLSIYTIPFACLGINVFNHMYFYIGYDNLYYRGKWFVLSQIIGILCHMSCLCIFIVYRKALSKSDRFLLLPFSFVPIIGAIVQIFSGGINIMVLATSFCTLFLTIIGIIFWNSQYFMRENELEQLKIAMRIGTFWPDFIYNTLDDISSLCEEDPEKASNVIDQFAEYLRKSMNDMSQITLHSFEEELRHLENYLLLEKIRFGDKLDVIYDIEITSFKIPSQVLQQTAELMIRYVMPQDVEVFCLSVHTEQRGDGGILVEFYDDAVEEDYIFRVQTDEERQAFCDINNRLKMLPGAHLDYESSEETGTMVKIYL